MSWNYRLMAIERTDEVANKLNITEPYFEIRTCYYDEGKTIPHSYADRGHPIGGEYVEDILVDLEYQSIALGKPIIWAGEKFPQEYIAPPVNQNGNE